MPTTNIDLDDLVTAHIITDSQKKKILERNQAGNAKEGTSRFLHILASFGAIITGLGIILLIATNWDTMNDTMKTILMISATGITYFAGYWWSYHTIGYPKTGQALMLLGSMFYGSSIFLLGQIYNLGGTFSDALLIWAIPIIILAYITEFISIFCLGIFLVYGYVLSRISQDFSISGFIIANIFIAIGYFSLAILRFHKDEYFRFGKVLSWTGAISILGGTLAYTFIDFWRYGGGFWYSYVDTGSTMTILALIVGFGVASILIDMIRKRTIETSSDLALLLVMIPLSFIFYYTYNTSLTQATYSWADKSEDWSMLMPTIYMNIFYIGSVVYVIYNGIRQENPSHVNIGMLFIALYLFGKYLAFAFDNKLDGAYIFIGGGITCIVITLLIEKIRRRLISSIE